MSIKKNNFLNGNPPMADDNFLNGVKDEINNLISYFIEEDSSNREQQANAVLTAALGGLNMKLTPESTPTNYKAVFSSFKKTIFPRNFTFFDGMVLWLNNTIENAGPATITILDRGPYNILNSDGDPLDTGMLKTGFQKLVFSSALGTFYLDEGSGSGSSGYTSVLFKWEFFDRTFGENSPWQRSDTFNWIDGVKYKNAYNHLLNDIKNKTTSTETVGDLTINYILADDGHKIILAADTETLANLETLYTNTGIAWYYILDTENRRFKLPRSQWNFVGLRPDGSVGEYVEESLPNAKGTFYNVQNTTTNIATGIFDDSEVINRYAVGGGVNVKAGIMKADLNNSSSVYKDGASVQQRANQMILYFYVGEEEVEPEEVVIRNRNIGEIFTTLFPVNDNGVIRLFGQEINVSVDTYKGFYQALKQLKSQGTCPNLFCTETEWQEFYTQHSFCPKFVVDEERNTVRMPLLKGYCKNVSSLEELGKINKAGLPNITGSFSAQDMADNATTPTTTGALYATKNSLRDSNNGATGGWNINFDASRSSSVYKDGLNTVEVDGYNCLVYIVVANSTEEKVSVIEDYEINNTVPLTCPVYAPNMFEDSNYLLSDNQWHSGEIYKAVWNLLTTQYNDENSVEFTKTLSDGTQITLKKTPLDYLICKIDENNTEEKINRFYDEIKFTCWVIDEDGMQFKLPQNTQRTLVESWKDENGNWYNLYNDGWLEQGGISDNVPGTGLEIRLPISIKIGCSILFTAQSEADYNELGLVGYQVDENTIKAFLKSYGGGQPNLPIYWKVEGYANTSALNNQFNFSNYLYFKVGNTTVGAELIYANKALTELDKKANISGDNVNFDNLSSAAKTNIANTGIPDYTQKQIISNGFIATSNGFIFAYNVALGRANAILNINNILVGKVGGGDITQDPTSMYAIVKKGDVITFTNMREVDFFPFINNI